MNRELIFIDITQRMFVQPGIVISLPHVERQIYLDETAAARLLAACGMQLTDIRSDAKFAVVLMRHLAPYNRTPPRKISAKKTERAKKIDPDADDIYTWAFAKSDPDFKELLGHPDENVVALVEARFGLKSTIRSSRAKRFAGIHKRMPAHLAHRLPVGLSYFGAGTGRYGANDKINLQNVPALRGSKDPDMGLLRRSMMAPLGHKVAVADLSQIEARLLCWLADDYDGLEVFASGGDPYSCMASMVFGRHVDRKKNPEDYLAGFIGKSVVLGCGYGLGFLKFAASMYAGFLGGPSTLFDTALAGQMGANVMSFSEFVYNKTDILAKMEENRPRAVSPEKWVIHNACAHHIIRMFRSQKPAIPLLWKRAENILYDIAMGNERNYGPSNNPALLRTSKDKLHLPNGTWITYNDMKYTPPESGSGGGEFSYLSNARKRERTYMYGGKLVENICQALATCVIKDAMIDMYVSDWKIRPLLQVHDEVVAIVPEEHAQSYLDTMIYYMTRHPSWAPGLPLAAEGSYGDSYGDAK